MGTSDTLTVQEGMQSIDPGTDAAQVEDDCDLTVVHIENLLIRGILTSDRPEVGVHIVNLSGTPERITRLSLAGS